MIKAIIESYDNGSWPYESVKIQKLFAKSSETKEKEKGKEIIVIEDTPTHSPKSKSSISENEEMISKKRTYHTFINENNTERIIDNFCSHSHSPSPLNINSSEKCQFDFRVGINDRMINTINPKNKNNIDTYVMYALTIDYYQYTGLKYSVGVMIMNVDVFLQWYNSQRCDKQKIQKGTLINKFGNYSSSNRFKINEMSKQEYIKYLRIDDYYLLDKDVAKRNHIKRILNFYGEVRVYTHYDWGYIDKEYFLY